MRRTDASTGSRSSGESVHRSMIFSDLPSASATVATWRQVRTIGPYASSVTPVPGRTTREA